MLTEATDFADDSLLSIVRRRAKPRVILLDASFAIAFAEPDAIAFLENYSPEHDGAAPRLPDSFERAVRQVAERWAASGDYSEQILSPLPKVLLRVSHLGGPRGSFIAVFVEDHLRREDLPSVAKRFGLTRREVQVLTLILNGLNAAEISERLSIAQTTVADYFKSLMRKTGAKNRADMLAKVLGWDSSSDDGGVLEPRM